MRTDDEQVADRLRWLDDEPAGPPRIDLPRAMREARRRRRNRRVAAAGLAALGVLAVAALPAALGGDGRAAPAPASSPSPSVPEPRPTGPWQGVCEAGLLPVPGDPRAAVTGGDPDGRWLVGRRAPQGQGRMDFGLLIWKGDGVREVELPGSMQELKDVNRAGLAVGSSSASPNERRAWAVRDGEVIGLPVVTSGGATAVNDAGRIVGYRNLVPGKPWNQRPVVWDSYRSQPVDLPLPGPQWEGAAIDIDEDGTILAVMSDGHPDKPPRAVVWRPGAVRPEVLPLPRVPGGKADRFLPLSLAGGWVTGTAERDTKVVPRNGIPSYPVRIDLRTGQAEVLKGVLWAGIGNGQGWLAGWVGDDVPGVITDTRSVKLPVPDGWRGGRQGSVNSFSDDARVLGGKLERDDQDVRPVRWTCR
ncbi:hypothetical protein [Micromonospora terminaliae]|uniref:Uncharacterized protein n=1 Tax=Micromonospora terminaliae TaxID=1914461 RepID=A0AAJ3DJM2_9ACTN|nr:hypothetical protein [Micromonospora terminaliae]NES28771.1 hypothetical protein [Micromonospora terminaliae]